MTNVGTPLYIAPEVDEGRYDSKVDVYSFGLIMYEIVTSDSRFSNNDFGKMQLFVELHHGERPAIDESVNPFSRRLIERCWSRNPDDRPAFNEIWHEIRGSGFDFIPGGNTSEIESFLSWIESRGGEIH
jgi:serine/threonine protein kinase